MAGQLDNIFYPTNRVRIKMERGKATEHVDYSNSLTIAYTKLKDRFANWPTEDGPKEMELYKVEIVRDDGALIDIFEAGIIVPEGNSYPFHKL
jgi:hypothetical protein